MKDDDDDDDGGWLLLVVGCCLHAPEKEGGRWRCGCVCVYGRGSLYGFRLTGLT